MEPQKKFDLLGVFDSTGEFHGSFATRALERIGSPDSENEAAPQRTHGAGDGAGGVRDAEQAARWGVSDWEIECVS